MEAGKRVYIGCAAALAMLIPLSSVPAAPTFQTYIQGATPGSIGGDQETWFTNNGTFNLVVTGAFTPNIANLPFGTLVVSVPQGQTGTIAIGGATLLTTTRSTPFGDIPNGNANADVLTNVAGNDAYLNKSPVLNLNNHFPYQNAVADFLYYDVGDFSNVGPISDFDAGAGTITVEGTGQEKVLPVSVTGFDWVHFDLGGYVDRVQGNDSWDLSSNGHDAAFISGVLPTAVPAPGSVLLGAIGVGIIGWIRLRKVL